LYSFKAREGSKRNAWQFRKDLKERGVGIFKNKPEESEKKGGGEKGGRGYHEF